MGAEVIVTVRMPASLVAALRERMADDHYADLSEQVRSVTRKGCLRYLGTIDAHRSATSQERVPVTPTVPAGAAPAGRDAQVEALLGGLRELLKGGERK